MKNIYSLLYFNLDSSGNKTGDLWEIGYFTSFKNAKKAMKKDVKATSKSPALELKEIYNENGDADFHLILRGEIMGMYAINNIDMNTILNRRII